MEFKNDILFLKILHILYKSLPILNGSKLIGLFILVSTKTQDEGFLQTIRKIFPRFGQFTTLTDKLTMYLF